MIRFLFELLLAMAGEHLCELIRPTRQYTASCYVRVNGGPWEARTWEAGVRRPWQAHACIRPLSVVCADDVLGGDGEVTVASYAVRREEGNASNG